MYICMYVCMCVCMYVCLLSAWEVFSQHSTQVFHDKEKALHTYINTYIHVYYIYMYVRVCARTCVCLRVCACVLCVCAHTCVCNIYTSVFKKCVQKSRLPACTLFGNTFVQMFTLLIPSRTHARVCACTKSVVFFGVLIVQEGGNVAETRKSCMTSLFPTWTINCKIESIIVQKKSRSRHLFRGCYVQQCVRYRRLSLVDRLGCMSAGVPLIPTREER